MSTPATNLIIRPLSTEDAVDLSQLLRAQSPASIGFFTAFSFDEPTISKILRDRQKDIYMGIYVANRLIGFFMLRGWDEGYDVPAYGIVIDEKHRGYGFLKVSLEMSKIICRLAGATRFMAKIHTGNLSARGAQRLGFVQTGSEPNGNLIYHMNLSR